jgi:hypothetical protein
LGVTLNIKKEDGNIPFLGLRQGGGWGFFNESGDSSRDELAKVRLNAF